MTDLERNINAGYQRLADFVLSASETDREPLPAWRDAIHNAAMDLDKIVNSPLTNPDAAANARLAMSALAHIWLTADEAETLYLGDRGGGR